MSREFSPEARAALKGESKPALPGSGVMVHRTMPKMLFYQRTAIIAREASNWTAEGMTLGSMSDPMREEPARRFCARIRELLDDIEADLGAPR